MNKQMFTWLYLIVAFDKYRLALCLELVNLNQECFMYLTDVK